VVGRWLVANEPFVTQALQVKSDFDADRIVLIAPENLLHEVTGIVHQAVFARRISARRGLDLLDQFISYDIQLIQTDELVRPAFELSLRYGCSYYDAIYLEIARRYNYPFIHVDGNLRRALNGRFPLEVWIEKYREA
jgi:predicted nucleic acid-binding protein